MNVVAASAPLVGAAARHRTAGRFAREIAPRRPSLGRGAQSEAAVRRGSSPRRRPPLAALSPDDSGIIVNADEPAPFVLADVVGVDPSASAPWTPDPEMLRFCEPPALNGGRKLKVAVLLSGGVDSSVALTLLKAAGHDCVAFYLQIWFVEDFRNTWDACPWEDDLNVARGVCEHLDVPLEVVPLTNQYWDLVVAHSIDQISRGRTPNPDMLCNSRVKFGAFADWLEANRGGEFHRVASGHYAAMDRVPGILADVHWDNEAKSRHPCRLVMSGDARKDQTYFLAHLSQRQLAALTFPIGGLPKSQIRQIARDAGLPNAERKDSQGICFLGKVKFSEFVAEHLGERPGAIVELETGTRLGTHCGFWFHTIGQRQGLGLSGGPWYVAAKDVVGNVVYVTRDYYSVDKERNTFRVGEFSWLSNGPPAADDDGYVLGHGGEAARLASSCDGAGCFDNDTAVSRRGATMNGGASASEVDAAKTSELYCKVRHGESRYRCTLRFDAPCGDAGTVVIDGDDQGLAAGQFAVFYDGRVCLGCGVIQEQPAREDLAERDAAHRTFANAEGEVLELEGAGA